MSHSKSLVIICLSVALGYVTLNSADADEPERQYSHCQTVWVGPDGIKPNPGWFVVGFAAASLTTSDLRPLTGTQEVATTAQYTALLCKP